MIKNVLLTIVMVSTLNIVNGQVLDFLEKDQAIVKLDEEYGVFERNKFDIIIPKTEGPHALVVFIHGGGFKFGDKSDLYERKEDILYFLDHGMAVATINYRFYNDDDSLGVGLCLQDVQRAIQYIRFNAKIYNVDKNRIGCYGISAGAGSSLFLAFHDDMAIPGNPTLLGESTRIKCAGAIATQSTYDVFRWKRVIPWMRLVVTLKRKMIYNAAANFYGYPNYKSFKKHRKSIVDSFDMLKMIDDQDVPVYLMNLLPETFPVNDNVMQHHKKHAIAVSRKLSKHNIENYLYTNKQAEHEADIDYSIKEFLVDKIK